MPTFLIVILAILFLFVLLLALRVKLIITCDEAVRLKLSMLCFTVTLFPRPKKHIRFSKYTPKAIEKRKRRAEGKRARKERRAAKKAEKKAKKNAVDRAAHEPKEKPTLRDNLALARALVSALVRKTDKHLRLKAARLHIRVATGDAATTAILYGAVSASLAYLLAALDRVTDLRTKPRDVSVFADYLSERSHVDLRLVFSLRVWGALSLLFAAAITFFKTRRGQRTAKRQVKATEKCNT